MAKPISFEFITDLSRFLPGMRQVDTALTDVQTGLKDVAREGDTLERSLSDSFDKVQRDASDIGDGIHRNASDGVKDAAAETGSEFAQNFGESFSSGDFSSIATDTAGGLAASLSGAGPLGLLVGAGALLGAEVFRGIKQAAQDQRDKITALFDLTDELTGALDEVAAINEGLTKFGGGDINAGIEKARDLAKETGISFNDIADALSGVSTPQSDATLKRLQERWDELSRTGANMSQWWSAAGPAGYLFGEKIDNSNLETAVNLTRDQRDALKQAEQNRKDLIAATNDERIAQERLNKTIGKPITKRVTVISNDAYGAAADIFGTLRPHTHKGRS